MYMDGYTKERRCKRCRTWCDTRKLYWGLCPNCLSKVQYEIDKATKGMK